MRLLNEAVGFAAKREVRRKWAKEEFKYVLSEKSWGESYQSVDETRGEYFTFGSLVRELGGWKWKPAILGAKLHFIRSMRMGGKWVKKDTMSSLLMTLRLKAIHAEVFETKWERFTRFHNNKISGESNGEAIQDAEPPPASGAEPTTKKATPRAGPKAKGKGKAKAKVMPAPEQSETDDPTGSIDNAISARNLQIAKVLNKECQKIKTLLKSCQADGNNLLQAFKTDPAYEWGKNGSSAEIALSNALKIDLTIFHTEYMMNPFAALTKRYNIDWVVSELEGFKSKKEDVDKLNELVQKLLRVHAANR